LSEHKGGGPRIMGEKSEKNQKPTTCETTKPKPPCLGGGFTRLGKTKSVVKSQKKPKRVVGGKQTR